MTTESFVAKRGGIFATGAIARQDLPSGSCHAWQDLRAMHDLRGLCSEKGPSLARCSPGVFPNGDLLGILNTWRAYLAKISSFWMHGGDILPGRGVFTVRGSLGNASGRYFARMRPFVCPECASRVLHSKGAPSSVRNKSRKRFVSALQGFGGRCRPPRPPALRALAAAMLIARKRNPSPVRKCSSKMLHPRPFGCAGERKMIIVVFPHASLSLRCRGILGDAVQRSFGCWISPLMLIARKRNRSPQNGARQDNGSFQCSLL